MNKTHTDIIVALATPYGRSAIAAIRMSGDGSIALAERFLSKKIAVGALKYNTFCADGFIERLMAVGFVAPSSYNGEETVELYPHGNMTVCDMIIKTLVGAGARVAERGEFTKRAFLNGKLDLMQCEALADIIDAQTAEQLNYGNKRFDGGFKKLAEVEKTLKTALSTVEAVLHYNDELEDGEADTALMNDVYNAMDGAIAALSAEISGFAGGKIINDGFKVAIIGEPNVGKSTVLNALVGSDRAIVTDIAGTTRDTVEGSYVYNDRKFVIVDTAGIRADAADKVEKIGISRALDAAASADAVLYVLDAHKKQEKSTQIDRIAQIKSRYERVLAVKNKCDGQTDVGCDYGYAQKDGILCISALKNVNITALKQQLYDLCPKDYGSICNHRQYECAVRCLDSIVAAKNECKNACALEIVAALLYEAYTAITDMYGENADEQVISAVFERFCVGK